MTLMEFYDFIKFIGNKDYNGNFFAPDEFNSAIQVVNLKYFKQRFGLPEDYQPGKPMPRIHPEATQKIIDDLREFKKHVADQPVTSGYFTIPDDYVHYDDISYKYVRTVDGNSTTLQRPVEELTERQLSDRLGNWVKKPTTKNPVCIIRADGTTNRIYIYPDTINTVDFHYYRIPVTPFFAYTVVSDELQYNADDSIEFEWPITCHTDLISLLFAELEINLRETELLQYAEIRKQKGD